MASTSWATWLPEADEIKPFLEGVAKFVADHVDIRPDLGERYTRQKSFGDPLLGYVYLEPWEVALVDTRLFQRLRSIHQLGLAHLVFPTLAYSRFEHTLGAVGRLGEVLTRLVENHKRRDADQAKHLELYIQRHVMGARLAALFHDVGHCLYSHVSERVLVDLPGHEGYPSAARIQAVFTEHFHREHPISIAEVLSIAILGSGAVAELLADLPIPEKTASRISDWTASAASFICGTPVRKHPETVFLAQLISSGLDVDKLDYMPREAHFSGIALEIDIERLLDKLAVFELDVVHLPSRFGPCKDLFDAGSKVWVLGLARGGQFAFEELCISRVSLYEKIYLHQKIRAAEAQLAASLTRLPGKYPDLNELHRWLFLTDSHVHHRSAEVPGLDSSGPLFRDAELERNLEGTGLERIDERAIVVRAFALGPANSLSDPVQIDGEPEQLPSLALLAKVSDDSETVRDAAVKNMERISEMLEEELPPHWEEDILVDLPRHQSIQQGHDSLYFERPTRLPLRWTLPLEHVVGHYELHRTLAYVFAPWELAPLALLAVERVVWDTAQQVFLQDSFVANGVVGRAEAARQRLSELGYYNDARPLKPIPEYLRTAEAQEMIQVVCARLSEFAPLGRPRVTPAHVTAFVAQFPAELQVTCLRFLLHVRLVGFDVLMSALSDTVKALSESGAGRIAVVPLGAMSDSGGHYMYHARDLAPRSQVGQVTLEAQLTDTLLANIDHLVLFDDNVNSGLQTLNILADWTGEALPPEVNLKEDHVQALSDNGRQRLREVPITFVFGVATQAAESRLRSLLSSHLGWDPDLLHISVGEVLKEDDRVFSGKDSPFQDEKKLQLRDFLRDVAVRVFRAEGKTEEAAERKAMGYGRAEATVVFPYNVPTMTIGALWCRGTVEEEEWVPLVERRRRTSASGKLVGEDA